MEPEQEDRIVTFALSPSDYYYELKLAQFLYKIDKIEGPTIEDLAVWCHNFAVSVLNKQLGQLYIVSAYKNRKQEMEEKKKLLPDFENIIPNPIITANPVRNNTHTPTYKIPVQVQHDDIGEKVVGELEKEIMEWAGAGQEEE